VRFRQLATLKLPTELLKIGPFQKTCDCQEILISAVFANNCHIFPLRSFECFDY